MNQTASEKEKLKQLSILLEKAYWRAQSNLVSKKHRVDSPLWDRMAYIVLKQSPNIFNEIRQEEALAELQSA